MSDAIYRNSIFHGLAPDYANPMKYGTAGFRGPAAKLPAVILRCSALAALRSRFNKGKPVGIMITASHNLGDDNGIKMIEPDGSMLPASWEVYAEKLVASQDPVGFLVSILKDNAMGSSVEDLFPYKAAPSSVFLGKDTRKSSNFLASIAASGVASMGGKLIDVGLVTTPQLHYLIQKNNDTEKIPSKPVLVDDYNLNLASSLCGALDNVSKNSKLRHSCYLNFNDFLKCSVIDCANGVGAIALSKFFSSFPQFKVMQLVNTKDDEFLNKDCGADYVQIQQKLPRNVQPAPYQLYWSLDGDGDRIIAYFIDNLTEELKLMDGAKFAALIATYLSKELDIIQMEATMAVVYTQFWNGAAIDYLTTLKNTTIECADTGVKHLEKAARNHEIGIWWEPNGHGTILFKNSFIKKLEALINNESSLEKEKEKALHRILAISKLANQATGDGIADFFLIQSVLYLLGWDYLNWYQLYKDHPSKQIVVAVQNNNIVETVACDSIVLLPPSLQTFIDQTVQKTQDGVRAFIRKSGTQNVIRVYAEGLTHAGAHNVAVRIARRVHELCGGVGPFQHSEIGENIDQVAPQISLEDLDSSEASDNEIQVADNKAKGGIKATILSFFSSSKPQPNQSS